jgi:hypothetical protein
VNARSALEVTAFLGLAAWTVNARVSAAPRAPAASADELREPDSILSLLEPRGTRCVWTRLDPVTQKHSAIATLGGDCRGGKIALSHDQQHGAIWFDPAATSTPPLDDGGAFPAEPAAPAVRPRLFEVDLRTGRRRSLPLPSGVRDLGFDTRGRLIALTVQQLTAVKIDALQVDVDGAVMKLEPAPDGIAVVVHALAFEAGSWKRIETANSTEGGALALGVTALDAAQGLAFRSAERLAPHIQGDAEIDVDLLSKLARFAARAEAGASWIRFGSGSIRLEVWEAGGELAYSTGLAAFLDAAGNPLRPPGWPYSARDVVSYSWNGSYLLVAEGVIGTHPRLYHDGKRVWSSDTARAVTFWPSKGC